MVKIDTMFNLTSECQKCSKYNVEHDVYGIKGVEEKYMNIYIYISYIPKWYFPFSPFHGVYHINWSQIG